MTGLVSSVIILFPFQFEKIVIITTPGNPKKVVIIIEIQFIFIGISISFNTYNAIKPIIALITTKMKVLYE